MSAATPSEDAFELSAFGKRSNTGMTPYLVKFFQALSDTWGPENPDGVVVAAVAENRLNFGPLRDKIRSSLELPDSVSQYQDMRGLPEFRAALSETWSSVVLGGKATVPVDHICVSSGCSALLNGMTLCLCEPGDAVLVPAPYYPGFENDCSAFARCVVEPVRMSHPEYELTEDALDAALERCRAAGRRARMLLFTHPSNPLGRCLSRSELEVALRWGTKHGLHVISDEVYACSVFGDGATPEAAPFFSMAHLCRELDLGHDSDAGYVLPRNVHILWGFSKDWGVSGFRVGMLWSAHDELRASLGSIGLFMAVSNATQDALRCVLKDREFTERYLRDNCHVLHRQARAMAEALETVGKPHACSAAMFIWTDLRPLLELRRQAKGPPPGVEAGAPLTFADEQAVWAELVDDHRVLLTPGESCASSLPGFFRVCTAWVPPEAILEMKSRLAAYKASLETLVAGSK